ncbi:hypothetical protein C8R44DRAFT_877177 [Mycena epipterygia]|nr:hypothetical protein C8R44DRAFT_877177 [Mycena epipterygia]
MVAGGSTAAAGRGTAAGAPGVSGVAGAMKGTAHGNHAAHAGERKTTTRDGMAPMVARGSTGAAGRGTAAGAAGVSGVAGAMKGMARGNHAAHAGERKTTTREGMAPMVARGSTGAAGRGTAAGAPRALGVAGAMKGTARGNHAAHAGERKTTTREGMVPMVARGSTGAAGHGTAAGEQRRESGGGGGEERRSAPGRRQHQPGMDGN